jgi:hypothetical protein
VYKIALRNRELQRYQVKLKVKSRERKNDRVWQHCSGRTEETPHCPNDKMISRNCSRTKLLQKMASKSAAETEEEDYDQGDQMSLRKKSPKVQPSQLCQNYVTHEFFRG